jgi:hypothetical protein
VRKDTPNQRRLSIDRSRDRRSAVRYPLKLGVFYRIREKDRVLSEGYTETGDISKKGVFWLAPGLPCPDGTTVELSINWPGAIRLSIVGEVLRTDERGIASRIGRYLFWRPTENDVGAGVYWPQARRDKEEMLPSPQDPGYDL